MFVTAVSATGEPLEYVHGSLQGNDGSASSEAENGAMLIIGPVPEGEYTLSVDSRDMVTVTKQLDLQPGETNLEVTLRVAPTVKGKVVLPDGKPANNVRVSALESDTEGALDFVGEDGTFTLSLQYPGTYVIRAQSNRDGLAETTVTVPCDPVTLTLNPKGAIEVELFDFDGTALMPNFIVRSEKGGQVSWINGGDEEGGMIGRLAGLESGTYTLEREIEDRIPMKKSVEVVDGKTTRVTFKADKGVTVTGKVIDADGKPVANAIVTVTDRSETTMTNEQGEFERSGLAAGMIELRAMHENGAETEPVKVKAPARDVVLKFAPVEYVTGRAVDDRGAPVTSFEANEVKVTAADGRFKVPAPGKTLDVWADGYVSVYLTVAKGDVGDVVLRRTPIVEGDVTDSEGKPVSGATVMGSADQGGVVTDANGRFKLTINSEEAQDLVATRGPLSGRTPLKIGTTPHIVMARGTSVIGRVVDSTGKGIPSVVTAVNQAVMRPMEIDTDENGRFQADLAKGVWLFSSRSFRSSRAIDIQGDRMEITIGEEAGGCGAVIHSSKPIDSLWFLAKVMERSEGPWEVVGRAPGSMEVPIANPSTTVIAKGIPCGHYEIAASIESMVTSVEADLRGQQQPVEMPLPNILLIPEEETPPSPETPPP
ncbi:MAG: carboxypeptidase-like regulatory domain-containing protein [Archangium sp.]